MRLRCAFVVLLVAFLAGLPLEASAGGLTNRIDGVEARASGHHGRGSARATGHRTPRRSTKSAIPTTEAEWARYRRELEAAIAEARANNEAMSICVATTGGDCSRLQGRAAATLALDGRINGPVPAAINLTPEQIAYIAYARIRLTAPKPMIGPSPDLNKWKMAAVGYPLWLWADGTLDPAPVSDSVYDVSVSLDAHLVRVVFAMGDGHKVTCTDVSREWTDAVAAGAESPSCGYRYQKPSLPDGSSTVTANAVWAIDWTVNGVTGTIPFYQSASTTIPVGELQVLTR